MNKMRPVLLSRGHTEQTRLLDMRVAVLCAAGYTTTEVAWLLNVERATVWRGGKRLGLDWKASDEQAALAPVVARDLDVTEAALVAAGDVKSLLAPIADLKPSEAIEHLVWLVGEILWNDDRHNPWPYPGLYLTRREARLLFLLDRRRGHVVHRGNLFAAAYAEVPEDSRPKVKILDVTLAHIRKKLKAAKVPARIEAIFGTGLVLHAEPGTFDWNVTPAEKTDVSARPPGFGRASKP